MGSNTASSSFFIFSLFGQFKSCPEAVFLDLSPFYGLDVRGAGYVLRNASELHESYAGPQWALLGHDKGPGAFGTGRV